VWGLVEGPALERDPFAKFRASPLFVQSRNVYEPGWTTQDRVTDPRFVHLEPDAGAPADLRPTEASPAVNGGLPLAAEWPDPLREHDADAPDIGAVPLGVDEWGVGVEGRVRVFGGAP
jgi:hypothetical protein